MREQSTFEPVDGGIRRRIIATRISEYEEEIVVLRGPDGRVYLVVRAPNWAASSFYREIALSDDEARIIAAELLAAADRIKPLPAGHAGLVGMAVAAIRDAATVRREGR